MKHIQMEQWLWRWFVALILIGVCVVALEAAIVLFDPNTTQQDVRGMILIDAATFAVSWLVLAIVAWQKQAWPKAEDVALRLRKVEQVKRTPVGDQHKGPEAISAARVLASVKTHRL